MNSTAEEDVQPNVVYAVVFGCIMGLGLPLNAVSLWILLRHHSLKSSIAVFMVNLAMSDLLLVVSLPMRVYFHATGTWPLSYSACILTTMLFRDNILSSAIFISFISVDRLLAVVYPLRSRHLRTSSNAWKAAALVWLFVLVMNIPEVIHSTKQYNNSTVQSCFHPERSKTLAGLVIAYSAAALVFALLAVNVVCTTMVFWTLRRHLSDSARINNKVNVMLIFALNLVMFIICFLPVSLGLVIVSIPDIRPLVCLATANCCLDPLLYYFSFDGFWKKNEDVDPTEDRY